MNPTPHPPAHDKRRGRLVIVVMFLFVTAVIVAIGIVANRAQGGGDVRKAKPSFEEPSSSENPEKQR